MDSTHHAAPVADLRLPDQPGLSPAAAPSVASQLLAHNGSLLLLSVGLLQARSRSLPARSRSRPARSASASVEAEDAAVEIQLRLERALDVLGAAEAVLLALERQVGDRQALRAAAPSTIISAWFGGTTLSSRPWNKIIGQRERSTWWIGERSRYRSRRSG